MMTKNNSSGAVQSHLFKPLLLDIVSKRHAMVKLADAIEPVIGHCKSEHRMNLNQIRG